MRLSVVLESTALELLTWILIPPPPLLDVFETAKFFDVALSVMSPVVFVVGTKIDAPLSIFDPVVLLVVDRMSRTLTATPPTLAEELLV
jgi:hypothetical protein